MSRKKIVGKSAAKRKPAKKKTATKKKPATKKTTAKKKPATKKTASMEEPGYTRIGKLYVPHDVANVVPASKLRKGFAKAGDEINITLDDITSKIYGITEIELSASFNANGKFMGFGVGGAASIKIKFAPK